ncbi:MAG TPA: DUF3592 domain-containing protein [Solirubrobacterales bacterium]|nr:DUF3592 domain-containing protein [Solirubrobacterales bacterium]
MFGKRKILKDGEKAEAVVVDSDMSGYSNSKGINKWKLKLRVRYDDGSTVDVSCSAYPTGPMGAFGVGEVVPVRYWPKDRSVVEVDRDAMVAAKEAGRAEAREKLIQMGEEKLGRGES